jgi:hypothetical protein
VAEEVIARPSADVAVRALRDRLVVVAGAVEQLPEGPMREALICGRDHYAHAIADLTGSAQVGEYADAVHVALHSAIARQVGCCVTSLGDVLQVLGGGHG